MERSEICCVCLRTNLELVSVTETDPNTIKWSYKLTQCVPEVAWNKEDLICQRCIEQVEAACAFRDLCLQSYAIRQQFLENNVHIEEVKTEEITIAEEESLVKLETMQDVPEDSPEYFIPHASLCKEQEFSTGDDYALPQYTSNLRAAREGEQHRSCAGDEAVSKSFLRDLLQTPKELLKDKNYTLDTIYAQENSNQNKPENISNKSLGSEVIEIDCTSDSDDGQHVEIIEKENLKEPDFSQPLESCQQLMKKQSLEKPLVEKICDLGNNGIELVEVETKLLKSDVSVKSLLRDLLLKPQEPSKRRNSSYTVGKDSVQYVEVMPQQEIKALNTSPLSDPLQEYSKSLKINDNVTQEESYLIKQIKGLSQVDCYICKHCSMSFKNQESLARHNKDRHQSNHQWECVYCTKSFKMQPELNQHEKLHANPTNYTMAKEYVCFHCDARFSSNVLLLAHVRYKHNSENVTRQCQVCQNTYVNQFELESHMFQKHNVQAVKFPRKDKKYKCDKCLKLYTTIKAKNGHYVRCDGVRRHIKRSLAAKLK